MVCNLLIFNDPQIAGIGQEPFFDSLAMTPELLGLLKVQDSHTISAIGWPSWRGELLARSRKFSQIAASPNMLWFPIISFSTLRHGKNDLWGKMVPKYGFLLQEILS
jgi:hypothetical protein